MCALDKHRHVAPAVSTSSTSANQKLHAYHIYILYIICLPILPTGPHIAISLFLCLHCLISPNRFACPSEANKDSLAGATTDRARSIRLLFGGGPIQLQPHRLNPRGWRYGPVCTLRRPADTPSSSSKGRSSCWSPSPPIFASETIPSRARPRLLIANREATCGWMRRANLGGTGRSVRAIKELTNRRRRPIDPNDPSRLYIVLVYVLVDSWIWMLHLCVLVLYVYTYIRV